MAHYFNRPQQGNGFAHLLALALVLIGLFSVNLPLQLVPFEFDATNSTYLFAVGVLCVLGGLFPFLRGRQHSSYY